MPTPTTDRLLIAHVATMLRVSLTDDERNCSRQYDPDKAHFSREYLRRVMSECRDKLEAAGREEAQT